MMYAAAVIKAIMPVREYTPRSFQKRYTIKPIPFKPPHIMKFQLAPCHNPPNSIVVILFILDVSSFLFSADFLHLNVTINAKVNMTTQTQTLPESIIPINAIVIIHAYVPNVAVLFPPKGI